MNIVLEDITKDNWEYVAFLTTNENKMPTLVEQYINGNAYSMLEALYRGFLMKVIVLCEGQKKKGIGFVLCGPSENCNLVCWRRSAMKQWFLCVGNTDLIIMIIQRHIMTENGCLSM